MFPGQICTSKQKAKKEYVCTICKGPILPGENYTKETIFRPGKGHTTKKICSKHQIEKKKKYKHY